MIRHIICMMIFGATIFATEVVWSNSSAISANEYKKAVEDYVDKTYPQKVQEYKEYRKYKENKNSQYKSPIDKGSYIQPAMVYIEAGKFMMGSKNGGDDEKPIHRVNIDYNFYIGKYEVTFAEYDKFCEDTGRSKPSDEGWGRENRPVINVSWKDAKAYTIWLSKKTGKKFRLPTEAEWEYIARAKTNTKWSFGNTENNLNSYGWCEDNSNNRTHKVGQKLPNPWEIYDIHGNVWEWCKDWYVASYNNTPRNGNDNNSGSCKEKVIRGGSWVNNPKILRSAVRSWDKPNSSSFNVGFRLLLEN